MQYGQGYFIQRPDTQIHEIFNSVLKTIKEVNLKKNQITQDRLSNFAINKLWDLACAATPDQTITEVTGIFKQKPNCLGFCVIENDIPVGIVTREKLALQLCGYQNRHSRISQIMDSDFLSVDYNASISYVVSMAMVRPDNRIYDFIVVTEDEKYFGIITIKDLLQKMADMDIAINKHEPSIKDYSANKSLLYSV